jgi:hypothetical protein
LGFLGSYNADMCGFREAVDGEENRFCCGNFWRAEDVGSLDLERSMASPFWCGGRRWWVFAALRDIEGWTALFGT